MAQKPNLWPLQLPRLPSNTTKSLPTRPSWAAIGSTQHCLLGSLATSRLQWASAGARLVPMNGCGQLLKKKQFRYLEPTCLNAARKTAQAYDPKSLLPKRSALPVHSWVRWRREGEPDLVCWVLRQANPFFSWMPVSTLIPCGSSGSGDSSPILGAADLPILPQLLFENF